MRVTRAPVLLVYLALISTVSIFSSNHSSSFSSSHASIEARKQAAFLMGYDPLPPLEPYNKEMEVINEAKIDYEAAVMDSKKRKRLELLCVTFVRATASTVSKLPLVQNIASMGHRCNWAIVIYDGSEQDVYSLCQETVEIKPFVVHCQRSKNSYSINVSIPKSVLYQDLLPILPMYEKVFMMDEDISLANFDIAKFLRLWECSFRHSLYQHHLPPLIVQPTVSPGKQAYNYFNEQAWRQEDKWSDVVAAEVGYVEQQVVMMDAIFFTWYVKRVLTLTKPHSKMYGVDWGHDRAWCSAGKMYATQVLRMNNETSTSYSSCAVITAKGTSVKHLNLKSMDVLRLQDGKDLESRVKRILRVYKNLFPTWLTLSSVHLKRAPDYNPMVEYNTSMQVAKYGPPMYKKLALFRSDAGSGCLG